MEANERPSEGVEQAPIKGFKKYIGVKIVKAVQMMENVFLTEQGDGEGASPNRDGYKVAYPDENGLFSDIPYVSWCPKDQFEAANRHCDAMPFGHAIEAMKQGKKVARAGWNGKGMFVYLVKGTIVDNEKLRGTAVMAANPNATSTAICSHINMKAADNSIVTGWLASQTDMLVEDWQIIE